MEIVWSADLVQTREKGVMEKQNQALEVGCGMQLSNVFQLSEKMQLQS